MSKAISNLSNERAQRAISNLSNERAQRAISNLSNERAKRVYPPEVGNLQSLQ